MATKKKSLRHLAFRPESSLGRRSGPIAKKKLKNCFQEDADKVITSLSFARANMRKQVYDASAARVNSRGGHILQTHDTARTLADGLGLNRDLTMAIALAHDLGHPAFSHSGEIVLSEYIPGFCHEKFGVILTQEIEALNLTFEVYNGILHHGFGSGVMTKEVPREYRVVALADKIAYTFFDLEDFGFIAENAPGLLPISSSQAMGLWREGLELAAPFGLFKRKYDWIECCCDAVIEESLALGDVSFSQSPMAKSFMTLRSWMHELYGPLSNPDRELQMIREVIDYLGTRDWEYDPLMLAALMVDSQVQALHRLLKGQSLLSLQWGDGLEDLLYNLVMFDYHNSLPKKGTVNLIEPDLTWARDRI